MDKAETRSVLQQDVVAGAPPLLEAAGVASRCEVRGADAFTAVPAGYETYLLSRVIHDWDDERSIALLTRSKQAMQPRGKVLLVERLILTGTTPTLLVLESDVQMLVVATSRLGSQCTSSLSMLYGEL